MYLEGQGLKHDSAEAIKWLKNAALQGQEVAQLMLGVSYFFGKGIPKNVEEAYFWISYAEKSGNTNAKDLKEMISQSLTEDWIYRIEEKVNKQLTE